MGGKNEDARVVLLTEEDRTNEFSEYHAFKTERRPSGKRLQRRQIEALLYWPHIHLDIRCLVSVHACIHIPSINTHTHITRTVYMYTVHVHALLVVCVIYLPRAPWSVLDVQCFGCVVCVLYSK